MTIRFVFDVESQGLYGEAFAVGWVVLDGARTIEEEFAICNPEAVVGGDQKDVQWLRENVYPWLLGMDAQFPEIGTHVMADPTTGVPVTICNDHGALREVFWRALERWKLRGAEVWADVAVPVEANFLRSCVSVSQRTRKWEAPYPLYDVATLSMLAGTGQLQRLANELPAHHPLMDSRQSAREILVGLEKLGRSP